MSELTPYRGTLQARAGAWTDLSDEALRRAATRAAHERDAEALWSLTEAYLYLHGNAGATISRHTLRTYKRGVLDLVEAWAGANLLRPRRDAGANYARALEARGLKPATVRVKLAAARALYAALRWSGVTTVSPFADVRAVRDPTAPWDKTSPYSQAELERLAWAADETNKLLLYLGAHAGLRIHEILNLRWEHLDLASRRLTVRGGKGGRDRTVVLSRTLADLLASCTPMPGGYVLPYRSQSSAHRRLKRLCLQTGVPFRGLHALRHSAGTRLAREHAGNLEPVARHLGHATLETTRTYAKWSDEGLDGSVGEW